MPVFLRDKKLGANLCQAFDLFSMKIYELIIANSEGLSTCFVNCLNLGFKFLQKEIEGDVDR